MSKSFRLANVEQTSPSTSLHLTTTDWKLFLICKEDKTEALTKPDQSKRKDIGSGERARGRGAEETWPVAGYTGTSPHTSGETTAQNICASA
ncbi:hypothetical protein Pmani_020633 [Petrolisthes manimaculis]|uniref:Uncharacterized protein n=1 Tax=Petrolisthes manimaculis TaxID=1843537 RepID=A0AAE1PGD5_9EUCA|nr:hypothetical protein Pmani_020633 [Petrolisthes manimaculis]